MLSSLGDLGCEIARREHAQAAEQFPRFGAARTHPQGRQYTALKPGCLSAQQRLWRKFATGLAGGVVSRETLIESP